MSEARVRRQRALRAVEQQHRCFYCRFLMCMESPEDFARSHHISRREAKRFMCTAEHLKPLGEGGTSRQDNIVAACLFCNQMRHRRKRRMPNERFRDLVSRRLERGRWHPRWLFHLAMS